MEYKFFGWDNADVKPVAKEFSQVGSPQKLYDLLSGIWCEYTCAPRLRKQWAENNKTVGQCSITAFLVQDIFGGTVYGIPLKNGGFHCYNVIGKAKFDLTSEQFGDEKLNYFDEYEQSRKVHFADEEKFARYTYLKNELIKYLK